MDRYFDWNRNSSEETKCLLGFFFISDTLTKCFANEWGENGVRVVGVAPGPIGDTEGMRKLGKWKENLQHPQKILLDHNINH